jgi:hypothetical protein
VLKTAADELARVYREEGRYVEARPLLKRSVSNREPILVHSTST